jgi:hypothetical protein
MGFGVCERLFDIPLNTLCMNCSFPVLLTTTCDIRHIYWTICIASVFNYYTDCKTDLDIRARARKLINSISCDG